MSNQTPKVSVIMGIYNCAATLPKAIDSLLGQTFTDWELILCDDGSTDDTYRVAESYVNTHPNIILLKNETNMGLNFTLNHCLAHANGEYIARQDGDDESLPMRFEKEVAVLDKHPEFAIVSSAMIYADENGDWGYGRPIPFPTKYDFIKGTPFSHPACMVRREAYRAVDGYTVEKKLLRVEDHHLWAKMYAMGYKGCNIQEPLYRFTDDRNAMQRRTFKSRWNEFRVKNTVIGLLQLPFYYRLLSITPLIKYCLPPPVYRYLHKGRLKMKREMRNG